MADACVADASPLIFLARIRHLEWLREVAPIVIVPRSVAAELEAGSRRDDVAATLRTLAFVTVQNDLPLPAGVARRQLGAGEAQVLAHALAQPGRVAVLDDRAARRRAVALGVPVIGTVGVVALLKQRGVVTAATPVLAELRRHGLRLSESVVAEVLREVGEAAD